MRVKATRSGEYPAGIIWTPGKIRDVVLADGDQLPPWLVPVAKPKKARKAKAKPEDKQPDADRG
mgnify:CR=1 FL=1